MKHSKLYRQTPLLDRDFDVIDNGGQLSIVTRRDGIVHQENLPGWFA